LSEDERIIEVISRWYGLSLPDKEFLKEIGCGSVNKGEELWLNIIGFTAVSVYCGALEMSIKEQKSLNPEHEKNTTSNVREQLESTINYLASNINLLKYSEEIITINEVFGKLISEGYISFTKLQRNDQAG
jgi:hypothetical protein